MTKRTIITKWRGTDMRFLSVLGKIVHIVLVLGGIFLGVVITISAIQTHFCNRFRKYSQPARRDE